MNAFSSLAEQKKETTMRLLRIKKKEMILYAAVDTYYKS